MRFRAVTFDVTGTLLRFRHPPGEFYAKVGAKFGAPVDPELASINFKSEWARMSTEHPNFGLHSGIGWQNWWREVVFQTFIKSSPLIQNESKLSTIYSYLISTYQTSECWVTFVGVHELLNRLSAHDISLGIISNNDERLDVILKVMEIRDYFKFVLTSYDAGFEKPDPRIFEKAFKMFKIADLKTCQVLHVGDKMELDYLGAEKVGWNSALVHVEDKKAILKKYPQASEERLFANLQDLGRDVTR